MSCSIHWFRKGLRLRDNPALLAALEPKDGKSLELRPVFILDPADPTRVGANRWRFLQQSLTDLDKQLRLLGSRLYVVRGEPLHTFKKLTEKWEVARVTWEEDIEPYSVKRDAQVEAFLEEKGVQVVKKLGHTLYSPEHIISKNKGETPLTYQKMMGLLNSMPAPPKPQDTPDIPKSAKVGSKELEKTKYDVPTLKELGVSKEDLGECLFPGGETEGLRRMSDMISSKRAAWVRKFEKPATSPNSLSPSTTVLSPYLKFGCVSPRDLYYRLKEIYAGGSHSQPPVSLMGQLYWREFYYTVGATTPNYDKMEGNKICRQVPWDTNKEKLAAWREARTGFPWIDAIMTQLKQEGWIHHLARHAVACFLTRGDLWQSWEEGQKVFEELLLDADWALNAGNWMWLSCSCFFYQYFRCYSPIAFGKKTDPSGSYIRKYLPHLAKYPDKYIYEPWTAPLAIQKTAGCIIGQDYPRPIVDHSVVSKENMGKMKKAYDLANSGKDSTPKKAAKRKVDEDFFSAKKKSKS